MAELGAGMELVVEATQAMLMNMRVDLRGRNVGVPEHHLHRPG